MKKILSIFIMATMAISMYAKVYFCDPAATSSVAAGTSWERAAKPTAMAGGAYSNGDTVCIKGGTIKIAPAKFWKVTKGVTIIGGYDPKLTGTEHTVPEYPSATPTIFDGDANGNGKPDAGDAEALIRVDLSARDTQVVTLQGLVLRNTFHLDRTESTEDLATYKLETSALRLMMGTTFVKNCEIYNHRAPINRGSQSITVVGARAHFIDCDVHDSQCMSRGGLMRLREYFTDAEGKQKVDPDVVIERCAFYGGNAMGGDSITKLGTFGGAIHASYGALFIINSTIVMDTCYSKGGAIRPNQDHGITLISSTVGNNYCGRVDDPKKYPAEEGEKEYKYETYGSAIGMDYDANFFFMNSYIVDDKDQYRKKYCLVYTDNNKADMDENGESGGYNVIGTFWYIINSHETTVNIWKATDDVASSAENTKKFAPYFGDLAKRFGDNGGCSKTIEPYNFANGAMVADLQKAADRKCPRWTHVDASRDQRGYYRSLEEQTAIGAEDPEASPWAPPTALNTIQAGGSNNTRYNLLGQPVDDTYQGIVIQKGQKYLIQ